MRRSELNWWWKVGILLVVPLERLLFRARVEGVQHLPETRGAILAFNHVSVLDGPVLAAEIAFRTRRELRFLVASEVSDHPIFGPIMRAFDQIFIHRGTGDSHALDRAIETVRAGAFAALAPEGHVADDTAAGAATGELQRIRSGVARIALPALAPIIPVGIWGTQARWPGSGLIRSRLFRRTPVAIVVGPALYPHPTGDGPADIQVLREQVRAALVVQVARAQALAGDL
jgi:1-acyl-sn-glycerol-3-phosphate acyltransferase